MEELIGRNIKIHREEVLDGECRVLEIKLVIERVSGETCICNYVSSKARNEDTFKKVYFININEVYAYFMNKV